MLPLLVLAALLSVVSSQASNETVLGVYLFHRHGDRTPKALAPANLTDLGYDQVYQSGQYYRNRYISSDASYRISGINSDIVKQSQISASAPDDTVLQNSATGFLQGLYPPVGSSLSTQTLRNGSKITAPMNGYQLIPVDIVSTGSGSEDSGWLQSTSNCAKAQIDSNTYFSSQEYLDKLASTQDFYSALEPVINGTFDASQISFKNAYTIYDLVNVATIHNTSIPSSSLLTPDVLYQLRTLADAHEWGLAYNSSESSSPASANMRAIAGKTLAAQIVQFLNSTIKSRGTGPKIGIQFGAYATFASFFGLVDLVAANSDFVGVSNYASAMSFELFTNSSSSSSPSTSLSVSGVYPDEDEIYVRFLFHNGTTTSDSEPVAYPLFGTDSETISWNDFTEKMKKIAISDTQDWCVACGNSTGTCAAFASDGASAAGNGSDSGAGSKSNGLSPAVNGVIGAMVILGVEAAILAIGGFRVVRKKSLAGSGVGEMGETSKA